MEKDWLTNCDNLKEMARRAQQSEGNWFTNQRETEHESEPFLAYLNTVFFCKTIKQDSVLSRHVAIWYLLSQIVKIRAKR